MFFYFLFFTLGKGANVVMSYFFFFAVLDFCHRLGNS